MEYTPQQLNYFRLCHIVFNLVPEGLRSVFKQEWDFLYKTLSLGEWKDTPQNGLDFYIKESPRSRTRNARYLATIQNGNTAEWDCTCLFFAILYSDSIGTTLDPAVRINVDDIRRVRNYIAHISEAELTDAEFQNRVGKVIAAFNYLKLPVTDVEAVKNQTSFPTKEVNNLNKKANNLQVEWRQAKSDLQVVKNTLQTKEEEVDNLASDLQDVKNTLQTKEQQVDALTQEINSKAESFCNLAFKPSHELIRRSTDVTRIKKKMAELEDGSNGAVSTIYLSGNPGCGKSQIARQLGQEFFDKRSRESEVLTFVATLNAETLETLADSYKNLAKQLGVTEFTLTSLGASKVKLSAKETVQHLKSLILPKIKQFCNWLIIADNVVDLSLVRSDLPPTASKEWGHGQVLITTQDSSTIPCKAPHTFHESLSKGMQPDDAVELLKEVSRNKYHEEAEKVAEVLDYQPLALAAAAYYVRTVVSYGSSNYTWSSYLESLKRGEREATEELLEKHNPAYSMTMTTAVKMAIQNASDSDEVLRESFRFLSLCASDSLPIEAVVNFVKARTTGQTEQLIRAKILTSSLITCLHVEGGALCSCLKVHNIVHEVLKTISMSNFPVTERAQCVSTAATILHSLIEGNRQQMDGSRDACVKLRIIITHCKALHKILSTDYAVKDILVNELTLSVTRGNVGEWLVSAASVCCKLGIPTDANVFSKTACDFVKCICSSQEGNLLKAEVFFVRGRVFLRQRDDKLSLPFYEKARDCYIAVNGEKDAKVALCYDQLGLVSCHLNQYDQTKEYYEKSLLIRREIYGEKHPDVARSYNGLGILYNQLGQQDQAKEYHEKALVIRKSTSSGENRDVAVSYHNLSKVYNRLGQHSEAKEYIKKALIIRKNIYGEDHPDVAHSYFHLALSYGRLGQHNEAKEYNQRALNIRKKINGEDHPHVADSYFNLALSYGRLGQHNEAKECDQKALIIRKKINGEDHPDVAVSYHNLARHYRRLGQHNEANECEEKALIIRKKIYGEDHPKVADSYYNLACEYSNL